MSRLSLKDESKSGNNQAKATMAALEPIETAASKARVTRLSAVANGWPGKTQNRGAFAPYSSDAVNSLNCLLTVSRIFSWWREP